MTEAQRLDAQIVDFSGKGQGLVHELDMGGYVSHIAGHITQTEHAHGAGAQPASPP